MNISPVNQTQTCKTLQFKGDRFSDKENTNSLVEAIDKNTKALNNLAYQAKLNSEVLYAIEKSKSGSTSYHDVCYSDTKCAEDFVKLVNQNYRKGTW